VDPAHEPGFRGRRRGLTKRCDDRPVISPRASVTLLAACAVALGGCGSGVDMTAQNESTRAMLADNVSRAEEAAEAEPTSPEAQRSLAHNYLAASPPQLQLAEQAWERYIALEPRRVDRDTAELMLHAYGPGGLDDPAKAAALRRLLDR